MQRCCPPATVVGNDFSSAALLFKALADPHRLTILATLAATNDEACVCDFTDALPLNQPTVSHHLRTLREANLVTCQRRGTWVYYRIAPDAVERAFAALHATFHQKVTP
jgi:ArsR family transcriptional regulator, arsenate/arsenite/antimonite-responsive transcriptional repressor